MKKLHPLLIVLAMPSMLSAKHIDTDMAQQIANQFITNVSIHTSSSMYRAPIAHQLTVKDTGFDNLYTFTDDVNGGFVVVAGDDRIKQPVLAYSTTDFLDVNVMPEVMQVMLQGYEEQIAHIPSNYMPAADTETSEREMIYPLVPSMWHQYLPFCYDTPYDNNVDRNTLVGCVALTLSQLMYFYNYPSGTSIEIPAYTTYSGYDMPALPPTTFDYSKMHKNYEYVYSREEVDPTDPAVIEVVKLMMYAGCALKMNYATGGSSSVFDTDTIAKYFGFDKGSRYLYAGNYPHDIWEEMVYNELKAGRPVPYSAGGVGAQNHQFIIDGYDGKGLFHANIGEIGRGSDNQYYQLGVIDVCRDQTSQVMFSGYNIYQAGIFGFQPDKGNDAVPVVSVDYGNYALAKSDFTRSSTSTDFKGIVLSATMKRHDNNGLSMDYGWGLYQNGLLKKVLYSATTTDETISLTESFDMGKNLAEGTYQFYPIFRNHGAEEWETYLEYEFYDNDGNSMRHYVATIEKKELHISVSSTAPNITLDKLEYYCAYEDERLAARAYFTNGGTNYENNVFYWINDIMMAGAGLYIDPGKSGDIVLCMPAPPKGTHNVKISTDWDGNDVIYTGKLEITEAPSCQLEPEVTVTGLEWNYNTHERYIHNQLDIVIQVKNVGKTVYNNKIIGFAEEYLKGDDGSIIGSDSEGNPRWCWNSAMYLHLEPNESKTISFSIGNETFRPNNYFYSIAINYYNNHQYSKRLYGDGYFYYVYDTEGITNTTQQPSSGPYYYDLQGRRVNKDALQPGIYIHNNKKMIIN